LTLDDVTDLRERAESTIESERINAITMLAAGVAHEIGNPLNSLTIHLQLLERQLAPLADEVGEDARELVDVSLQEVRRLDTIINQFLKAVRPGAFEPKPVAMNKLIAKTLQFMTPEIEDRGVLIEAEWPDDAPAIMGDETQLQQALYNVIKNGVQAMETGGILVIKVFTTEDFLVVSIADSGKGIDRSQLGDIFNPYYTTKEDGTGLGLVIVERIIREHGAEFGIDSEVDRGTVVSMRFPLRDRRQRLLAAKPQTEQILHE
jgi:two-component system, sporulation sensor kinase E